MAQDATFGGDDLFRFACHKDLACFKRCCRDVNIFLTPFDVLRMRRKLAMSSTAFLDQYTTVLVPEETGLPVVMLKMGEGGEKTCQFLEESGCRIYAERPWSCRMAPVDIAGEGEYRFIFEPSRCLGLDAEQEWTMGDWVRDQGLDVYDRVEAPFRDFTSRLKFPAGKVPGPQVAQMFYMGCYDLDRFRKFVLESRFLDVFDLPAGLVEQVRTDDMALLHLGIAWLDFGLADINAMRVKESYQKEMAEKMPDKPLQ
ncbi:MAG: YkgJ family cysteine cluster protein [Peptococcaceae bacterium]|jgi:Fe-S-cluster containining protein|nr:YkgJ family cysteine cluster protein [Peptococcaceae bacterium]